MTTPLVAAQPGSAAPVPAQGLTPPRRPDAEQPGLTTVADRAVGRIAGRAAVEVPDVLDCAVTARVTGGVATLDARLDLRYPAPVAATAARVRAHLVARVAELTGLRVSVVDVAVGVLRADAAPVRRVL
ncbi:Asp23/Gls24 family envelope stress response protein [Lentzea sp. HUAS12]|uniref:Asp23/Gls24 family envelope stress response protein n=1 Tax=Lentzea sp. HUAS12 TaxID=2951806 RepID=UPI00209D14C5|nr:Asp23/Gls24 family envelope stress response protein [Lentzea sp. HUAS12]USX48362.1 Asp23/Gls24 family envelope stress response protein [Lentzea sp. HUAS12]